jgi:REP element-mobilizing transposase RayT
MPQSLAKNLLHITFSTKGRRAFIVPEVREALKAYLIGTLGNLNSPSIETNCVADHVHILCVLSKTLALSALLEEVKKSSSKWIKTQSPQLHDFYWQGGYGAFSVSESNVPAVRAYIRKQEAHHRTMTFQEEFRALLRKHGIEFDERYVWD